MMLKPPQEPRLQPVRTVRHGGTSRAIAALMLREMATSYGRSVGGYAWVVLEPLAGIVLLTLVFTAIGFRAPPLGTNFALFYATGLLPFLAVILTIGKLMSAINYSRALLAYPAVTYVDALLARFVLSFLTQAMVAAIVVAGITVLFETRTVLEVGPLIAAYGLVALLSLGLGTANCFLASMFPSWQVAWSIAVRPLVLVSCIFYTWESVPPPYRDWLWFNPVVHIVGLTRAAFYPGYDASYASGVYVACISLGALLVGMVFLHRYHRDILYQ